MYVNVHIHIHTYTYTHIPSYVCMRKTNEVVLDR